MKCPSCEELFSAPMGHAEGGCYFCGVRLKVSADVKVVRDKDESGVKIQSGWEEFQRPRVNGREERPMFVMKKEDESTAVY